MVPDIQRWANGLAAPSVVRSVPESAALEFDRRLTQRKMAEAVGD